MLLEDAVAVVDHVLPLEVVFGHLFKEHLTHELSLLLHAIKGFVFPIEDGPDPCLR